MLIDEANYLAHSGIPHEGMTPHSGRYEWGSGEDPAPDTTVSGRYKELKSEGMAEKDISKALGMTTREMKARVSQEVNAVKQYNIARVKKMAQHGESVQEIEKKTGLSGNTIRTYINSTSQDYKNTMEIVKDELRSAVNDYKFVDVGLGAEGGIAGGVTKTRLENAVKSLCADEGYVVNKVQVDNLSAKVGKKTTMTVLSKESDRPSNEVSKEIYANLDKVGMLGVVDKVNGDASYQVNPKPVSISSSRVQIAYESPKDGVMEIRPGCEDLSLGSNRYAQVRIAVDDTHYLKGVAIYNDNLPKGVDVRFNTNKSEGTPMMSDNPNGKQVLKSLKDDPENPFGATTHTKEYIDKDGNVKRSAVNVVNEEGTWEDWSKSLPSQFLSKQSSKLIKQQLDADLQFKKEELEEIRSLSNPEIKRAMLEDFAGSCDSSAEELRGAALPRQKTQLILPVPSMKDNEVYAPNFQNGERVCLVRYPHQGTFEIPELTVNNNQPDAKKIVGMARDAIGINANVAERLSGADFDGDTVVVLPNNNGMIKSTAPLAGMKGFDAKKEYGLKDRRLSGDPTCPPKMTAKQKEMEMGIISNLVTDMTFQGAPQSDMVRAVKHAQLVIDAEKHDLDFRQSEKDNNIAQLHEKYQGKARGGASTIVSRATGETQIAERKGYSKINPKTGEIEYTKSNDTHWELSSAGKKQQKAQKLADDGKSIEDIAKELKVTPKTAERYVTTELNKDWKSVANTESVTKMSQVKDARQLMSGYDLKTVNGELVSVRNNSKPEGIEKEYLYADYANRCKAMANEARKESLAVKKTEYNADARHEYASEVAKITAQVHEIEKNKPIERHAQAIANVKYKSVMEAHPEYKDSKEKQKKEKTKAVAYGRAIAGSKAGQIKLTDREYEAVLKGAFSSNMIKKIIDFSDSDHFKSLATPRTKIELSDAKQSRIKTLALSGATYAEIAKVMGVSATTVSNIINGKE